MDRSRRRDLRVHVGFTCGPPKDCAVDAVDIFPNTRSIVFSVRLFSFRCFQYTSMSVQGHVRDARLSRQQDFFLVIPPHDFIKGKLGTHYFMSFAFIKTCVWVSRGQFLDRVLGSKSSSKSSRWRSEAVSVLVEFSHVPDSSCITERCAPGDVALAGRVTRLVS